MQYKLDFGVFWQYKVLAVQVKPPALVGASTLANEFRCGLNCLVVESISFNETVWLVEPRSPGSDAINVGFGGKVPIPP